MPDIANPLVVTALIIAAYLIGSVPFAVVVSKLFGLQDPRSYGSGNPGATNVLRSGNKAAAALTLIGDAAKGWLAVWIAIRIGASPGVVARAALAVFLGHLYPLFLGFKGGKGDPHSQRAGRPASAPAALNVKSVPDPSADRR